MMLVDTNVLSAMMRIAVEPAIERWLERRVAGIDLDDKGHSFRKFVSAWHF